MIGKILLMGVVSEFLLLQLCVESCIESIKSKQLQLSVYMRNNISSGSNKNIIYHTVHISVNFPLSVIFFIYTKIFAKNMACN